MSFLLVTGLFGAAWLWILETLPYDPSQQAPPAVDAASLSARWPEVPNYSDEVPVINYHVVSHDHKGPYTLTPELFARHMEALARAGFHTVTMSQLDGFLKGSGPPLPSRPVMLTFDDGPVSTYTTVDPILAKYGFKAVAFLITGQVAESGRPSYYLSTGELRQLAANGRWEFGGHTHDQHRLASVVGSSEPQPALVNRLERPDGATETLGQWEARVRADLSASQAFFVRELGRPATSFAFPFGASDKPTNDARIPARVDALLREAGYSVAFNAEDVEGRSQLPMGVMVGEAPLRLPRLGALGTMTEDQLLEAISTTIPDPLAPRLSDLTWTGQEDAQCALKGSDIEVISGSYGTCAPEVHYQDWTDYRLDTEVVGASEVATAVIAVRDSNTVASLGRIEVVIGQQGAIIREEVDSQVRGLAELKFAEGDVRSSRHVTITVKASQLTVAIEGLPDWSGTVSSALALGRVTFAAAVEAPGTPIRFGSPTLTAAQ